MTPPHLRSVLIASLLSIALLLRPSSFGASEEAPPQELPPYTAPAAEAERLRREVEALRDRVRELERRVAPNALNRPGEDPGERDRLLAATRQILAGFNGEKAAVWRQALGRIRELRAQATASLKELQDEYTRDAMLDEALAVRAAICFVREAGRKVHGDPGILRSVKATAVLFFRVTGAGGGSLYGTDVYTSDSSLATAAVHAGVLKVGQTGIVKVTTYASHTGFVGSTRNGITSSSWSSYPGYRVEAPGDEDQDLDDGDTGDVPSGKPQRPPNCGLSPRLDVRKESPRGHTSEQPLPGIADLPANIPAEAREQVERFTAKAAEIRKSARAQVSHMTREAVARLIPVQDAHTRAARLEEAIAIRDLIRKLTENAEPR